ncbi:MAG: dihydrodipicolinate reductase C-terminal domain-containing protein [Bacilli bacterium]|jgi:4-hydroxy-tetrahydrodipicolinate reductase|nr:dihydrodipicolinate reductase C-terminal domain-containing protein [Bacilli bacterium]HHU24211.1 hypothetical protein [Acholeplasmataceae bacterium]
MSTWQMAVLIMGATILTLVLFLFKKQKTESFDDQKFTVLICGINGKMGAFLAESLTARFHIIGLDPQGRSTKWPCFSDITQALEEIPDIMLDFAGAKGIDNIRKALLFQLPVVSGSTGFTEKEIEELVLLAKKQRTSLILNANFSRGISDIMEFLSKVKSNYSIKLKEAHHKSKKDAPSGTAKLLSLLLEVNSQDIEVTRYDDFSPRHTVELSKQGERIIITHEVFDRSAYLDRIFQALERASNQFVIQVNGIDEA